MSKKTVVKLALAKLETDGLKKLTLQSIGSFAQISAIKMQQYFPNGSNELLMDAVELAGLNWVKQVEDEVSQIKDPEKRIRRLAILYAFGTQDFPESLSVYIDIWKMIKDEKSEYLKTRLKAIYQLYSCTFIKLAAGIEENSAKMKAVSTKMKSLAMLMTILSDMLHIQFTLLENNADVHGMRQFVEDIAVFVMEESHA